MHECCAGSKMPSLLLTVLSAVCHLGPCVYCHHVSTYMTRLAVVAVIFLTLRAADNRFHFCTHNTYRICILMIKETASFSFFFLGMGGQFSLYTRGQQPAAP